MPPTRIHHLNFIVRDLDEATAHFERVLGVAPFKIVDYAARGAHVARTRVGETWLVLVCPYDGESVPGRYLAERGEGFFLASFGTDDLQAHLDRLRDGGIDITDSTARDGILDWQVADIGEVHGARLQLTRDKQ